MKNIFSLGCLLLILMPACIVIANGLEYAPGLTIFLIALFISFLSFVAHKIFSNRKPKDDSERLPSKAPEAVEPLAWKGKPSAIFETSLENKEVEILSSNNRQEAHHLSVELPDELNEENESPRKDSALEVKIDANKKSAVIVFNRLRERNPLSLEVLASIEYLLDEVLPEYNLRTIIFTGKKDIFASGANLNEILKLNRRTAKDFAVRGQDLMSKIANSKHKTIAAINGVCFGGALDLALACDERVASPNSVFSHPGANLGIITGWGGTQRLPRLIGEAKALEMFLTAKKVSAEEALRFNLIDAIAENPLQEVLANLEANRSSKRI